MANILTSCRILCSIPLLIFPAFSPWFYAIYLISGFTDMIDGAIARKTNTVSEFGSKLDTVAEQDGRWLDIWHQAKNICYLSQFPL